MKKGQIWVETVIYTLIAFAMIGLVLQFVKPKIEEIQDQAIIEQSITVLRTLDSTIFEIVQGGAGNKRNIELKIKKGALTIDSTNDSLIFEIESKYEYSEPGKSVYQDEIEITNEKKSDLNLVTLARNYTDKYNITYNNAEIAKSITKSPTIYVLSISNQGNKVINFELS